VIPSGSPAVAVAEGAFIAGLGTWLPPLTPVEEAVRLGHCDAQTARKSEMTAVAVDHGDEVPAELAVRAAQDALAQAGCAPDDIALVLHAYLYDQGNELWSAAAYVQRRTGTGRGPAIGIQQVSNGGMASLYLASTYLKAMPGASYALVTTADRFALPGYDRWHSDPGTVYADGGTAVVLSAARGFARLLSLSMVSDPDLEGMHRAGRASGIGRLSGKRPVDLGGCKADYVSEAGTAAVVERIATGQREAMDAAFSAAGTKPGDIDWFILPHFGKRRLSTNYLRYLDVPLEKTNWHVGRMIGHLGAGDQIASLAHLLRDGRLRAGQRCALIAVGAGFTWSCGVVEVSEVPEWPRHGGDPVHRATMGTKRTHNE
jgi:3-oxoacyl-[acyl-carrier-protein] synthase-3